MKKIILDERQEKTLFETILQESIYGLSDKVNIIKKYLDNNFIKADYDSMDDNGDMKTNSLVIMKDTKQQPTQHRMTLEQLFEKLKYKYQNIITNKEERDKFLWQLVNDWYNNRISKNGNLTKY